MSSYTLLDDGESPVRPLWEMFQAGKILRIMTSDFLGVSFGIFDAEKWLFLEGACLFLVSGGRIQKENPKQ